MGTYNTRSNTKEFVRKGKFRFEDEYSYDGTNYITAEDPVEIGCKVHGLFWQSPNYHLHSRGCPKCYGNNVITTESFIADSIAKYGVGVYNYGPTEYKDNRTPVKIICVKHAFLFEQILRSHFKGYNACGPCITRVKQALLRSNTNEWIERALPVHGTRYDYSDSQYIGGMKKIAICCRIHGIFWQGASAHLMGQGCPTCTTIVSKAEIRLKTLIGIGGDAKNKCTWIGGRKFKPDAIDHATKTIWELDGDYWHGNPAKYPPEDLHPITKKTFGELYQATLDKADFLASQGYRVISIWESDFVRIEAYLTSLPENSPKRKEIVKALKEQSGAEIIRLLDIH